MKQSPKLEKIQMRMAPGALTLNGFLGTDSRKLVEILDEDSRELAKTGFSTEQIAHRLVELTEKGRDLMEQPVTVEERYSIAVRDDRGVIPSPWGDGLFGKGDTELTDSVTGRHLRWNSLTIHLIKAHGFFNGIGSDYRIEPTEVGEVLNLTRKEEE